MVKFCIICGSKDFEIKSDKFCSQKCIHKYGVQKMNTKVKCEICDKEISKANLKKHLKVHKIKIYHYFCENCGKEVFKKYGSCRFCSKECAKGFSTKAKRKDINEKVSLKIKEKIKNGEKVGFVTSGRLIKLVEKECPICHKIYISDIDFGSKTCSKKCGAILGGIKNLGTHHTIKDSSKMGGLRPGGGKSKQLPYTNWLGFRMALNKEEIEVAKILDEKKLNWNRNKKGFPYITQEGKQRKYYPDFVIDNNKYIEYKGWTTEEMTWKMTKAKENNNLDLTIIFGRDKRYKNLGKTIDEFKMGD